MFQSDSMNHVEQLSHTATQQIRAAYPDLQLHYIIHGRGELNEKITLSEHEIIRHPAGMIATNILRKSTRDNTSSFIGLAAMQESNLLGMSAKDHLLALMNINIDEFDDIEDTKRTIYHLAWHAIDLMHIRARPDYYKKYRKGPIVPKRSPMNMARANMQADCFAAIMCALQEGTQSIERLSFGRSKNALLPVADQKPEDFPFAIATDTCLYGYERLDHKSLTEEDYIPTALKIAQEVGVIFDDVSVKQWWAFSEPAQDMAWRGHQMDEILGAAVNTCEDAFVRAIGYLVADTLDIEPMSLYALDGIYNGYVSQDKNSLLHREMIEKTFKEAIELGLEEESSRPLLNAANEQNEKLTEGKIIGWCANALQAAAKAFEQAMASGLAPEQAARVEFDGIKASIAWDDIDDLGRSVIGRRRQGYAVTMGHIAEICNDNPLFAPILNSIQVTLNDPVYIKKLEASNDLALTPNLAPVTPAPKGPSISGPNMTKELGHTHAPQGPAPGGPALPGLGISRTAQMIKQRLMEQRQKGSSKQGEETEETTTT